MSGPVRPALSSLTKLLSKPRLTFIDKPVNPQRKMPKAASTPPFPLQGLFPIAKPTGPTSMKVIDSITPLLCESKLFEDPVKLSMQQPRSKKKRNSTHMGVKIGQGGTLDPLADGVLVIGVNRGTKHLNRFLDCSKEYVSIGLLGAATTTMDSEGPVLTTAPFDHVKREDIERVLGQFRGQIQQTPPIFSALKMDGKPLYEYARESKPLPRAIPVRSCTVTIDLLEFTPASTQPDDGGHTYRWPTERLSGEEKEVFRKLNSMVKEAQSSDDSAPEREPPAPNLEAPEIPETSETTGLRPATFKVRMTVSGGTYVRSIVNDIGLALGSAAHVVLLTRTRQGEFSLHGDEEALAQVGSDDTTTDDSIPSGPSHGCIPWSVWERAIQERKEKSEAEAREKEELIASGASEEEIHEQFGQEAKLAKSRAAPLKEWENEVLRRFVSVPVPATGSHGGRANQNS